VVPRYAGSESQFEQDAPDARREGEDDTDTRRDLHAYLRGVMSDVRAPAMSGDMHNDPVAVANDVVELLFSRPFSYLGRSRARVYEDAIRGVIVRAAERSAPIPFYFDIGGGYHATIHPGEEDFSFDVGLGELFVIAQIARLRQAVARFYAPGVRFSLVIDNLCALLVNDIQVAKTLAYCTRLRRLIEALRLTDLVSVLVESEHFSEADLAQAARAEPPADVTPMTDKRRRNVERFLGRPCTEQEALEREARYHAIVNASDRMLNRIIDGVRMTQRATTTTMCFRPFPGGDSRIQSGQVVMTRNASATLHPMLLTSANVARHACSTYRFADVLPPEIDHVIFAEPVGTTQPLDPSPKV
jgi:hypothetical protein